MTGLGPVIHDLDAAIGRQHGIRITVHPLLIPPADCWSMTRAWVYIMANRPNGTLYVGMTNDLVRRVWEHRGGIGSVFTRKYCLKRLVYFEAHNDIRAAIQRETSLKRWPRAWKVRLLAARNPEWDDLYPSLIG